ncbi:Y-family DNA polymerase [Novosphingobium clariflavum]|uniref:DNA polymerase Y family protein n=3 Tax=Novosphingobium TaxID=165696 RepID=A0ABV6S5J5_9SPHN
MRRSRQEAGATQPEGASDISLPPLAMVAKVRGALRLAAVDARAQALGIVPGMTLADARALEPELVVTEMDEGADRQWLERLARDCRDWSPRVTLAAPDGITLDIAGVDHLFGGETGLCTQIEETMAAIGMTLRHAIASTPEAAQALARHGAPSIRDERAAIRALPVLALGLDADSTLALNRAGIRQIGDLTVRPSATIAARFGAGAIHALYRLMGEEQAPIDVLRDPEPLHFERRFAEPVALQATIATVFMALLQEAATVLAERDLGGHRFVLTLYRTDGARHRLAIETGRATRDPALVLRLFDERIASLADPLDPGFGYDRIGLFLPATDPLPTSQPSLDGREKDEAELAELIERLSTRLGPGCLLRLAPRDSHLPEQAQLALPAMDVRPPVPWPQPPEGGPPMRPLFLFDPPQRVEVLAEVPDGPPHRFRWRRKLHEVRLYEGPERIANEWWRHKGGECAGQGGLTRDYYRVEDVQGRRYWIFRHGLYEEKPDPQWYLHGLFA